MFGKNSAELVLTGIKLKLRSSSFSRRDIVYMIYCTESTSKLPRTRESRKRFFVENSVFVNICARKFENKMRTVRDTLTFPNHAIWITILRVVYLTNCDCQQNKFSAIKSDYRE